MIKLEDDNTTIIYKNKINKDDIIDIKHLNIQENQELKGDYENENNCLELGERIFTNFILDISEFLPKKEKILLRELSKSFEQDIFSQFQVDLNMKRMCEVEEFNPKNYDLTKLLKYYKNVETLKIETIKLNKENFEALDHIINTNIKSIKYLSINNLEYDLLTDTYIEKLIQLFNKLNISEIEIGCAGNPDQLFLYLEHHNISFGFSKKIKKLKIDNCPLAQLLFILNLFPNVDDLTIKNCSLDEDLAAVADFMKKKKYIDLKINRSGLSSNIALDSLRLILSNSVDLETLELKGLWIANMMNMSSELQKLQKLTKFSLSGSKYLFSHLGISTESMFTKFDNLKILDMRDTRMKDQNLDNILKAFSNQLSNTLEELIISKNLLSHDTADIIVANADKLKSLSYLDLGNNNQIRNKGFDTIIDNLHLFNIKKLDMRGIIFLKTSYDKLIKFLINNKDNKLEQLILYFSKMNENEYNTFFKKIIEVKDKIIVNRKISIFLKLKKIDTFVKTGEESLGEKIYKERNIFIR